MATTDRKKRKSTLFITNPPAAQKAAGPAVLVCIHPPGPFLGRRFTLHGVEMVVGRLDENQIALDTESVSRRHARLVPDGTGWAVEDLGSTNGTWVNDERVTRRLLVDGDQVRFGGVIAKFLSGDNLEAGYHEEIYRMSVIDALTGCHNKRYFLEFLEREIAGASRHCLPLTLVMFDLDHFKRVNDTHGHLAGDAVLKEVGRRLRPRMRREDLLARYGGEEFACVLTKTAQAGALVFAESLRQLICREPFAHEGLSLPVTISVGVAELVTTQSDPSHPDELIKRADDRLYEAKRTGRNRVVG